MPNNNPIWIGSTSITETVGSPKWSFSATRTEVTRVFAGPYATLLAGRPNPGNVMTDFPGYIVDRVDLSNDGEGGKGTMTVTLTQEGTTFTTTAVPDPTYEIDWVQLEKKLETHNKFRVGGGGTYALTAADLEKIEAWRNCTTASTKATARAALSANAEVFAQKIDKGEESYIIYSPVARKTSYQYQTPTANSCGTIETPIGFTSLPSGYTWLRTADRAVRTGKNGKWERQQEWTGADSIDTDIYSA